VRAFERRPIGHETYDGNTPSHTFLRRGLIAALLIAGAVSVPRLGEFGPVPTTAILDVWIVLFLSASISRGRIHAPGLLILLVVFLFTRVVLGLANLAPVEDFLQAYRWVLYLIALTAALGRDWGPIRPVLHLTWALLAMAAAKGALTYIVLGPGERPGLLLENNFELALFCGLVAVLYKHMSPRARFITVFLLAGVTILAASRSGAVAFLLLVIYALTQSRSKNLFLRYVLAWAAPIAVLVPLWIFAERQRGVAGIDRLNFLDVFLFETRDWDTLTWLWGTAPITPLSAQGCLELSYYQLLFSSTGDGSCYSVILHAFVLRVLFDAGIFGLLLAYGTAWYCLNKAGNPPLLSTTLVLIAFTNGLSVSGLNNPYVFLPLLLAVVTAKTSSEAHAAPFVRESPSSRPRRS